MDTTIFAYLFSAGAVVLAEMGDKTQLLAMAFATKYKASKVMLGVLIATIFNHALAVFVGNYLTRFDSAQVWIQGIASLSFILFGLWTIRGDHLNGEDKKILRFGAVATVTFAFFLAEMGDKTQLATIALATKFPKEPLWILMGTTTGMLIADAFGIIVGVVLCKRIPERKIKLVSAGAFMVFGFIGCYQVASQQLNMDLWTIASGLVALLLLTGIASFFIIKKDRKTQEASTAEFCKVKQQEME